MNKIKNIGVLTGGGDCPGLNPAIRSLVLNQPEKNIQVLGFQKGWQGLLSDDEPIKLNAHNVQYIDAMGGSILGSSRTNPYKSIDGPKLVKAKMERYNLDALVAIGGEDTLGVLAKLHQDLALNVVGIPKTIDGDLSATDYCLGLESAVETITSSVDKLRSTAATHQRILVVEVMGRHAGHLAFKGGLSAGADFILVPEVNFCMTKLSHMMNERKNNGQNYQIIVVAEGATPIGQDLSLLNQEKDAFGHVRLGGVGHFLAERLQKLCGLETRAVVLSHLQRGGAPCAFDRRMGHYFGLAALKAINEKDFGKMVCLAGNEIILKPLSEAVGVLRLLDVEKYYCKERYQASSVLA